MMKMRIVTIRRAIPAMILVLLISLAGCGVEVTDDEGAKTAEPPIWQTAGVHYADTAITSLNLIVSPEFSSPTLVDIYARVEDQNGLFVTVPRLNQYNFTIAQGTQRNFVDMTMVPYPDLIQNLENRMYAIAIDSSGSMLGPYMDATKVAAKAFAGAAVGTPGTTCAVIDFDDDARLVQKLTADVTALNPAIDGLVAEGNTAIGDALVISASQIGARPGRGAIVIMTDGANTAGRTTDEALTDILQYDLPVYAVGIGVSDNPSDTVHYNSTIVNQLATVTAATGGKAYFAPDPTVDLTSAFADILAQTPPLHDAYRLHSPLLMFLPGQKIPLYTTVRYSNIYGTHEASSMAAIEIPLQ
jgi:uncharacterized protein YegL